ncbi:hypothetical protein GS610_06715 [Ruegeria sp. HKCCD6228]|uniref:hypothetical protein n=1 Tax=Ruegeria sp. HKCCD6228 TaxID=2683001 RepID=UPI001492C51F|nr:hypothetical protein [Ruegeria sp. HKCCD6228]NOD96898.1 hypothetical protein [Ruegeria sp. HKCCD6228]
MTRSKLIYNVVAVLLSTVLVGSVSAEVSIGSEDALQPALSEKELAAILSDPVINEFSQYSGNAFDDDTVRFWASKAKKAHQSLNTDTLDASKYYDVVLQVGHYPRKKGVTGGEGELVIEQEIAALVATLVREKLVSKLNVVVIPADGYKQNIKTKIFLALHTDSAPLSKSCQLGPSIGYNDNTDALGMRFLAFALARTFNYDLSKFMSDNYTKGLRSYYAFKHFNTTMFEGVLEMEELTCPEKERNLLVGADDLATNLALALELATKEPEV